MAVFQLGFIIRNRREELGLTQEDLADGICSEPTLSRIENGERLPTKNHYEMLMQRLGYSTMSLDFYADRYAFLIHELKFKIRQAYVAEKYLLAKKCLEELEQELNEPTKIDTQFVILYQTLLSQSQLSISEKLYRFEEALQLTCPKYKGNSIPRVLSYEEIILLNNIAICYSATGNHEQAIFMLNAVKDYYERHIVFSEEALRTQPMILYNLSKFLGLAGKYDECIEVCDLGIRIARVTGRCPMLGETLYNRAWALIRRNHIGDRDAAKRTLKQAIYFSEAMEAQQTTEIMRKLYMDTFMEPISI